MPSRSASTVPVSVEIDGHVGFYCGGMNKEAEITVNGHAGAGVAENMMSGGVRVKGNCLAVGGRLRPWRAAGDRGRRLLALRHLDEGRRHRGRRLGRPHERLHGPARQPRRLRRCRRQTSAIRSTRRGSTCRGKVGSLGADCVEKKMTATSICATLARLLSARRHRGRSRARSAATARPASSTISTSTMPTPTDRAPAWTLHEVHSHPSRASRRPSTTTRCREIHRAADHRHL